MVLPIPPLLCLFSLTPDGTDGLWKFHVWVCGYCQCDFGGGSGRIVASGFTETVNVQFLFLTRDEGWTFHRNQRWVFCYGTSGQSNIIRIFLTALFFLSTFILVYKYCRRGLPTSWWLSIWDVSSFSSFHFCQLDLVSACSSCLPSFVWVSFPAFLLLPQPCASYWAVEEVLLMFKEEVLENTGLGICVPLLIKFQICSYCTCQFFPQRQYPSIDCFL